MTKEEFKTIPKIEKAIKYKQEQLYQIRAMMISVPSLETKEKVQTSPMNKSMSVVDEAVDLERKLHEDCILLLKLKNEAYDLIRTLEGKERLLMELRYINGCKWIEIAKKMNYNYRHVTKMHGEILSKLFDKS